jgi:uncharacterized RDD family membrane protein YckC
MNRHVAVASLVPERARPYQGSRAGFASRALANSIDLLAILGVLAGIYFGAAMLLFLWNPRKFHFPGPSLTVVTAVGTGIAVAYFAIQWMTSGRTYGDYVLGLRVVDHHGRRLRAGLAVLRAAACVLFPIGLFWTAVSRDNRCVQDIVLRTSVIYDWVDHEES